MAATTIWAVHDGKIGMANQAIGLAEAVSRALGGRVIEKRLAIRAPWRWLPPQFWPAPLKAPGPGGDNLAPPWPHILVSCGRLTAAPALAAKRASRGHTFWALVQDPGFARAAADLIVAPCHDRAAGTHVFETLGAVHRVTKDRLSEAARRFSGQFAGLRRPLVAVLIGGDNRAYRLTDERLALLIGQLAVLAQRGYGIAITTSRRTGARAANLIRERLPEAYLWAGQGGNPYYALLALADAIVVTADSVNMVSEAAATGKPVHVVPLEGGSTKFARFHEAMRAAGITRDFAGAIETWRYDPPDDTAHAAAEIARRFMARGAGA
jgi:uncharacterized protein